MALTLDSVMAALRAIRYPGQDRDLITAGRIHNLKMEKDGVSLRIVVPAGAASIASEIEAQIKAELTKLGAKHVDLQTEVERPRPGHAHRHDHARTETASNGIPGVKHIVAVSSGKGGVGKSTVAANLACALSKIGHKTGLLDTDVYGPNIPTMMGIDGTPQGRVDDVRGELILPLESHGVSVMSMGFLAKNDQPLVWRGPMLHSVVSQFLLKVDWGNLDYLVVDMPPGTGDVQLSLTQLVPVDGAVVVTTPQEVSLQDVRRAILMFEKVSVPILGVVENMSYFVCDNCERKHFIFGSDGGSALTSAFKTKLLAQLPLAQAVREAGDEGSPIVVRAPESVQAKTFLGLASAIDREVRERATAAGGPEIGEF